MATLVKHLELNNHQSPGDILMLTALVRDWKLKYPNDLLRVNTSADSFFDNSPHIEHKEFVPKVFNTNSKDKSEQYDTSDSEWIKIMVHYSDESQFGRSVDNPYSVHKCGSHKKHFMYGMYGYINKLLGLNIKLTSLKPDIYLSNEEKEQFEGVPDNYWLVVPGGKPDYKRKIWAAHNWEELFKMFPQITFVQIGGREKDHIKPVFKVPNVINLSGKTSIRDVLSLIYNSQGVISPITFAMHAAAALDKRCIVIAGGGEHHTWESYSAKAGVKVPHDYLHTCGMLKCCKNGGCWCGDCINQDTNGEQECMKLINSKVVGEVLRSYL
jgi:ADP-heptose:LPS heptosyltransferase